MSLLKEHPNNIAKLKAYLKNLGIKPNNIEYYLHAMTHRSYSNEINQDFCYERLEYLGDAIIDKIVCENLYNLPEKLTEGNMSTIQRKLVQQKTIARAAKKIKLDQQILVGKGVDKLSKKILCDCFEAFVAAVYLDQKNEDFIKKLINQTLFTYYLNDDLDESTDYKSMLQELLQSNGHNKIQYKSIKDLEKNQYTVTIIVNKVIYGQGVGSSIRDAERVAAKNALEKCCKK
ncbi:Ribonuclease III [[Mycoplasma] cavipharyngis]|uniref:ribonuclease III n=1 Tax=[Mycoplasma] cavipharyngis TaxID=92757 RepID=UPI0037043CA3